MARMDPVVANSINYLATSIEAVALRVRRSIGAHDADRTLEWAKAELERLATDANEIAPEARNEEREAVAQ